MNSICRVVIVVFVLASAANIVMAKEPDNNQNEICNLLKKEKGSVAYLLDEQGKVSKGPISFGRYGYVFRKDRGDLFYIPTKFRMVISPARLHPKPCTTGGCLELKKVVSVCKNSNTYSISYANQEYRENPTDNTWLPYKVNETVSITTIQDQEEYTGWAEIDFNFELRVVGDIYDATKKKP